ncbi:MAG: AzlD domain-containing protein [Clostridia bacterium]|nr:AzlD domain-containing protein [Clostridia bacterium]
MRTEVLLYVFVMALTTYLVRMLPVTLFRRQIKSRFAKSFFAYIPYAVLAAMTVPAIFGSTETLFSALAGMATAVVLAWFNQSLIVVSVAACIAAYLVGLL